MSAISALNQGFGLQTHYRFGQGKKEKTQQPKPLDLPENPIFKANRLTPFLATKKDLIEIYESDNKIEPVTQSFLQYIQESFSKRTDKQLREWVLLNTPSINKLSSDKKEAAIEATVELIKDPVRFLKLTKGAKFNQAAAALTSEKMLKRFILVPPTTIAGMIVLKDEQGKIQGYEAYNPFQRTHDFQLEIGDTTPIDPKHIILSRLHVKPEYRGKGIGKALKETAIALAHKFGAKYVWSLTEATNPSRHINEKLGFKPLTETTVFPDSPAFDLPTIKELLTEYNRGQFKLQWFKIPAKKP